MSDLERVAWMLSGIGSVMVSSHFAPYEWPLWCGIAVIGVGFALTMAVLMWRTKDTP